MSLLQKITESPWTDPGLDETRHSHRFSERADKRVGLVMFLAVVTSLFFLFIVAYIERMELGDWDPLQEPGVLWFNTALLALASVFMQRARNQSSKGTSPRLALVISGLLVFAFLAGQCVAWRAMAEQGYFSMARPAFAFFYLLTTVHGLHLLGGLWVWARTVRRAADASAADLRPTLELCAIYWHYLLLVWVVLFVLMLNT